MTHDYASRQAARNRDYAADYDAWVKSLSPEGRSRLAALGLDKPDIPHDSGGYSCDAADLVEASYVPDIAAQIDRDILPAVPAEAVDLRADTLASFCARLRSCSNPAMVFDAVCYATGVLAVEGQSATELAAKHGVTKQAFSKVAVDWCTKFGLPPARSMKSKRARVAYRERAKAVHQRHNLTRPEKPQEHD